MTFSDFVTFYWHKTRRNGSIWTPQAIAEDSGLTIDIVNMYLNWCTSQVGLTDANLIEKFNDTQVVINTPMGSYIGPKSAPTTVVVDDSFWAMMDQMFTKHLGK
jgi:hypothetical protein